MKVIAEINKQTLCKLSNGENNASKKVIVLDNMALEQSFFHFVSVISAARLEHCHQEILVG